MTRRQMVLIIAVNAIISAVISVTVVLLIGQPEQILPAPAPTAFATGVEATPAVAAATPTSELVIHVIQAGDTISGLAYQYDVPEQDIIAANSLQNPNFLQVGMELIIPVGGLPQATSTFTPAPTATDTPIPFQPPSADMTATAAAEAGLAATPLPTPLPETGELQVAITEIMGAGEITQEQVIMNNSGDRLADMQGWTLSDADGNIFTFPNFRLWGGGNVTIHSRVGQDGNPPGSFYWGKLEAIWSPGEEATLRTAEGAIVSTYTVGP